MKHTPTAAMQSSAKRGLALLKKPELSNNDIPEISRKGGAKIASGQKISDDHVRSMAQYHAGHAGSCPAGNDSENADDLLWGGPAGASWAASRVAAMDATSLAESDSPDMDKLISEETPFSSEIFARRDLLTEERTELKKDADGLIWAPILRSGTLAVRPGPNGTRLNKPLVFVPGHASNSTEIGLQDLVDAHNETAVQHVTIPDTHSNGERENNGYIVKMKIADSTMRPGEKVILGGHKFTEPDTEGRVERGSIANRSCGILHGYQNTETGKVYPHVIEHVALTNKPWVTGMESYGDDLFTDDRQVVPLLLSEDAVITPPSPDVKPPVIFSTRTPQEELEAELKLADIAWDDQDDGEPSLSSIQTQLYSALRDMGRSPYWDEDSIYFSVRDVKPSKALVEVDYGGSDPEDSWIIPYSMQDGKLVLSDFSQWQVVHQAWVADDDANQDKAEVQQILQQESNLSLSESQLNLATLTAKARKSLNPSDFVFPSTREYPINDLAHARNALARGAQNETGARLAAIKAAVYKRYPNLKPSSDGDKGKTNASLPTDPLKRASQLRLSAGAAHQQTGGRSMSGLTPELLAQLNLSDTDRELLQREMATTQSHEAELAQLRAERRQAGTRERLTKLADAFGQGATGLLKVASDLLMADDGDVAVTLLADTPGAQKEHLTVTDVIDRLLAAMPVDDKGKIALANKTNLLENPISGRPDLEPEPTTTQPKSGDELLAEWNKDLPGLELAMPKAS